MTKITITNRLLPFREKKKRVKIVLGGRGGTKSRTLAQLCVERMARGQNIGCFREYQNTMDDSVHKLLVNAIATMQATGFEITDRRIRHASGGESKFRGLSKNTANVKSFEGFSVFWVEEGQFLSADTLETLIPTLREAGSELWISLNIASETDAVFERYIQPHWDALLRDKYYEDDDVLIIWTNYDENPWFPEVLEQSRQWDFNNLPRAKYKHIWLGYPDPTVTDAIIKSEWVDAAVDAHLKLNFKPRGAVFVSHDPSDDGADAKGLIHRHGTVVLQAIKRDYSDFNEGLDWATSYALDVHASLFTVDGGGAMGMRKLMADTFKGRSTKYQIFKGQETPYRPYDEYEKLQAVDNEYEPDERKLMNKDKFRNKRAQFYAWLANMLFNAWRAVENGTYIDPCEMLSLSSECTDISLLKDELCKVPRKYNASGLFQVMSKPEMRAHKLRSPNIADALMMSLWPYEEVDDKPLNFTSFY